MEVCKGRKKNVPVTCYVRKDTGGIMKQGMSVKEEKVNIQGK